MFRILALYFVIISFSLWADNVYSQSASVVVSDNKSSAPEKQFVDYEIIKKYASDAAREENSRLLSVILPQIDEIVKRETDISNIKNRLDNLTEEIEAQKTKITDLKAGAKSTFDKAQKLADDGKIKEASFYYAVACAADPTEGLYIFGYVKAILNWADRTAKRGLYGVALEAMGDMESFLYSYSASIPPSGADSVAGLIKETNEKIKYVKKEADLNIQDKNLTDINAALKQSFVVLNSTMPENEKALEYYKANLENSAENIIRLSQGDLSPAAQDAINKISSQMRTVLNILDIEKYLKRANELVELAATEKNNAIAQQIISEAAAASQKLSFTAEAVSPNLKRRILQFGDYFAKISAEVGKLASATEFEKLKNRYDAVILRLIKNETVAQGALRQLAALQDEIVVNSIKISDGDYLKQVRGLLTSLNTEIDNWREIQLKRYDMWGIKTVRKFYDAYKNEPGLLGSGSDTKDRLYLGIKDYLCPIEVRYLGASGLRAYTEVFDFFYKELDRERRLELSSEFVNCEKRPLSFF